MRTTLIGVLGFISLLALTPAVFTQQPRTRTTTQRPAAQKQPAADIKISYRSTTSGQAFESTTMIKGSRERSEMNTGSGMDLITITQCDLKRTVQISERVKKYVITPMNTVEASPQPATTTPVGVQPPSRRGGVVTYTSTATDTGERKEMFGFTARHIKTSLTIQSSPDACNPTNQKMETDGWYIDLSFGIDCDLGQAQIATRPTAMGGCRDRVQFNRQGVARTGYPLSETTTMYGPDGRVMFSTTKEVVELSRAPLDAALFDVPAGYVEARDTQELYAVPSMAEMMSQANQDESQVAANDTGTAAPTGTKAAGVLRVGVVTINNKTNKAVSIDALRQRLVGNIESAGLDAVPLNAISQMEAEIEAKAKQCDFILYTDITSMKTSKLGGMFGRVTGVEGAGKTEAKLEYKLFAVGESAPRLQMSATSKQEGEEESVGTAIDTEAKQVSAAVKKRS